MTWPLVKIGDIANVKGGKRLPKGEDLTKVVTKHPYIRARDIGCGKITFDDPVYLSESTHEKISRYITQLGDVCITIVGANVGDVGQVPRLLDGANLTENAVKLTGKFDDYVSSFVKHALLNYDAQKQMKNFAAGAAQPKLGIYKINEVQIPYPEYQVRLKVSQFLDEYDNLIENNNQRIAILEEVMQSLYREWFVHFRYPEYLDRDGQKKLVDSPLGKIPVGWEILSAADSITINPRIKLAKDGEKFFVGMSGLSEKSMIINDIIEKSGNSGAKFINGDTLFARITPCLQNGKTGFVQFLPPEKPVGFGSTEFIVLRESEKLSSEFIYLLSRSKSFRDHSIKSMTGATGRQRVHPDSFASFYLAIPPKSLMDEFTEIVKPIFKNIFNISQRNENLRKQRDMLLPKLISGVVEL